MPFLGKKRCREIDFDEYGLLQPTSGEILVKGEVARLDSPSKSAKMGIGMVHQHFMLVEAFTVAENIILGNEVTKKGGILNLKKQLKKSKSYLKDTV